jgi:hypothetical protein
MRRWVHGAEFDLVAFVLDSDLLRVGINMESLQSRRTVRAFEDLASAVHWASRTQDVSPVSVRAPARKHA